MTPPPVLSPSPSAASSIAPSPGPLVGVGGGVLDVGPYLVQLVLVTALVLGLAYALLRVAQRRFPGLLAALPGAPSASGKRISVVERHVVDAKRQLLIVGVGDRRWLLGATDVMLSAIAELDPEDHPSAFAGIVAAREDQPPS